VRAPASAATAATILTAAALAATCTAARPPLLTHPLFAAAAAQLGAALVRQLLDKALWDDADYRLFYNVNFPPVPAADVKGTKVASQGFRRYTAFSLDPHTSPSGRQFLWIKGGEQAKPTLPGTDVTANVEGYIAVTPLRCDLTAHEVLKDLEARLA
jgi:5'-nucleotidase